MAKKWLPVPGFIGFVTLIAGFLIQDYVLLLSKWNSITRYPVIFIFRVGTGRVLEKKFGTGRVPGSRQTLDARELARKTALKLLVTTSAESRKPFSPANDQRILQATVLHCILGPVRLLWNKALIGTISGEFKQRWSIAPIDQHIFQAVMLRCTLDWVKLPWKVSLKLLLAKYQHHFLINPCSDAVLHPGPS